MRFKIITAYTNNIKEISDISYESYQNFCNKNNIEIQRFELNDIERPASWYKIQLILDEFKHGYDYIMWVDADTLLINNEFKIESILDEKSEIFISDDILGINCGVMIWKNTENNKNILNKIWDSTEFINHFWWEQAAIISVINTNYNNIQSTIKKIPQKILNSYDYNLYANNYEQDKINEFLLKGQVDENSFIFHLPGVSNETRLTIMKNRTNNKKIEFMTSKTLYQAEQYVKMDENHIDLIYSLIISSKPKKILEIGVGTGAVSLKLLNATEYNQITPDITCVDNFYDWNGQQPNGFEEFKDNFKFVISDEKSFVESCSEKFDFIVSDADHLRTNEWVDKTLNLLNDGGILIYHDVTNPSYPNLFEIVNYVRENQINYMIFNKNSLQNERCERGLLVIQK